MPGSFVHVPRGWKHWFRNNGDTNARMLVLVAPGGMEAMFTENGRSVVERTEAIPCLSEEARQRIIAAAPKFGIEIVAAH